MRGWPLYSPATHLHGFCSLPNLRGYYIKKILLAKVSQTGFITTLVPFADRQIINMKLALNDNLNNIPVSGIRRFGALAAKTPGCVFLSIGEPDFDTPPNVKNAAYRALENGVTHYPPNVGTDALLSEISEFEKKNGRSYGKDCIIFTVGATEALFTALCGILNPQDEVIIPVPAFGLYEQIVNFCRAKCVFYDTSPDKFQLKYEKLAALVTPKTKAIILNSPNNPTGSVYTRESLDAVHRAFKDRPVFIISDEVYRDLSYSDFVPSVSDYPDLFGQTFIVQSFSKPYAMTGWRAGYLMGDFAVINEIKKIHQLAVVSGVSFVMDACITALREDTSAMRAEYRARRDYVCGRLDKMQLEYTVPQGAFYIFPSVERFGIRSEEFCTRLIKEAGLCLVPGSCFGNDGYVRISYCYSRKALKTGLDRLEGFINSL